MKKACLTVIYAAFVFISGISIAETIAIPAGQQAADKQNIVKPVTGQTKTQVSKKFGEPTKKISAVGNPPISRWVYDDYTVYFDNDYVIHSALHP